jgi:hypothetical protein
MAVAVAVAVAVTVTYACAYAIDFGPLAALLLGLCSITVP